MPCQLVPRKETRKDYSATTPFSRHKDHHACFGFCLLLVVSTSYVVPSNYRETEALRAFKDAAVETNSPYFGVRDQHIAHEYPTGFDERRRIPDGYTSVADNNYALMTQGLTFRPVVPPNPDGIMATMKCVSISTWLFGQTKIVIKCPSDAKTDCRAVYGSQVAIFFNIKNGREVILKPGKTFVGYVNYWSGFGVCNPHATQEFSAYGE